MTPESPNQERNDQRVGFRERIARLNIRQRIQHLWARLIFYIAGIKSRVAYFFVSQSFVLMSILFFLVLFVSSLWVTSKIRDVTTIDTATLIVTAAGMIGGMLAIVFSVQTLVMQNAAERASSGFFKLLARDKIQVLIFWIIALFTVCLFGIAFVGKSLQGSFVLKLINIQLPFILIGTALWLLFVSYRRALIQINPSSMIGIPAKLARNDLNRIQNYANKLAKVIQTDPKNKEHPSDHIATATAFQLLSPEVNKLQRQMDFFFDYHDKLASAHDKAAARAVLLVVQNIILHYFTIRKDSSVLVPTEVLLANTSDSQSLLTRVFEGLVDKGNQNLTQNDDTGVTQVIQIFKTLIIYSSMIDFHGRSNDNPIFNQGRFYLDSLIQKAAAQQSMEGLFQGALAYIDIGKVAVRKQLPEQVESVKEIFHKIVVAGLQQKQSVVWDRALTGYLILLEAMVRNRYYNIEVQLRSFLRSLEDAIFLIFAMSSTGLLDNNFINLTNLNKPFETIARLLFFVSDKADKATKEREINDWKNIFLKFADEYRSMLRSLSEKVKSADRFIIQAICDSIESITTLLIRNSREEKWSDEKKELLETAHWYIHQPAWFFHHAQKVETDRSFDSIVECVTKIGLAGVRTDNDKIAEDAINILSSLAIQIYGKTSGTEYGFTEPRIMERACYIGILALKKQKKELVSLLKTKIPEFQTSYEKNWFSNLPPNMTLTSPTKDQLKTEISDLKSDLQRSAYNRHLDILDDSKSELLHEISESDIDAFTMEIWGETYQTVSREVF